MFVAPVLASPDQITGALSVASCAGQFDLIDDDEREALDALLVDGTPLATVRAAVGDLLLRASHESALEYRATAYLKETPPTRGRVLRGLVKDHSRMLELITAAKRGPLADAARVSKARARVAKAGEEGLFGEGLSTLLARFLEGDAVTIELVEHVEQIIRWRAAAREVMSW